MYEFVNLKPFGCVVFVCAFFLSKIRIHFFYFYQSTKTIDSCRVNKKKTL